MGLYGALFAVRLFAQSVLGFSATPTGWLLAQPEAFHKAILLSKLSAFDSETNQRLSALTNLFQSRGSDVTTAHQQALASLEQLGNTQAAVLFYADIFRFVGVVFLCSLPLLLFLGKGKAGAKAAIAH